MFLVLHPHICPKYPRTLITERDELIWRCLTTHKFDSDRITFQNGRNSQVCDTAILESINFHFNTACRPFVYLGFVSQ